MYSKKIFGSLLESVLVQMQPVFDLKASADLLGWDQETFMPSGAYQARADQISTLQTLAHQLLVSDNSKELADKIRSYDRAQSDFEKRIFALFLREHDRAIKIPNYLIKKLSMAKTVCLNSWKKAYEESNFKIFESELRQLIDLKIQETEHIGYDTNKYDALLDFYEPGMNTVMLDPLFNKIKKNCIDMLQKIKKEDLFIKTDFFSHRYTSNKQDKLARYLAHKMKFDLLYGRQDISMHPFTAAFSSKDVRMTYRINERDIRSTLFSVIHETGHALYEQGIDSSLNRTFAGEGASYGIHESQALIWENIIARSEPFIKWLLPYLQELFPRQLSKVNTEEFYRAINKVEPGCIRTEADELTYNLHIIVRYEIEKDLINGNMRAYDIPHAWSTKMHKYLGIVPKSDREGSLQDIHWAFGGFGYFPTYTMGKMYAAMFWKQMQSEIDNIESQIESGDFKEIRQWLKNKIHRFGKINTPKDLLLKICDKELNANDYLDYLRSKFNLIYDLN